MLYLGFIHHPSAKKKIATKPHMEINIVLNIVQVMIVTPITAICHSVAILVVLIMLIHMVMIIAQNIVIIMTVVLLILMIPTPVICHSAVIQGALIMLTHIATITVLNIAIWKINHTNSYCRQNGAKIIS